jgi:hypothetical protein
MAGSSMYLFWKTVEDMFKLLQTYFVLAELVFWYFKNIKVCMQQILFKK